mgnify:FL=1|jgi:hypothetical protein
MFLYRTHPTSENTSSIINLRNKEELTEMLSKGIDHRDTKVDDIISLVTDASVVDAMISLGGYSNILVLPTPITQERLRDENYAAIDNAGDMLFPIIHNITGGQGNVYVGLPEEGHLYKKVWEDIGVVTLPMTNWFSLDRKIDVETDIIFDAVVLLGCDHSTNTGTFKSEDIKSKLGRVIHENTHLIDVNRKGKREISGATQDISGKKTSFVNGVNSQKPIFNMATGFMSVQLLNELVDFSRIGTAEARKHKTMCHYHNLCHKNIAKLEDFYKVYK